MADWTSIMRVANRRAAKTGKRQVIWSRQDVCKCWKGPLPHVKADGTVARKNEIVREFYVDFNTTRGDVALLAAKHEVINAAKAWAPTRFSRTSSGNVARLTQAVARLKNKESRSNG